MMSHENIQSPYLDQDGAAEYTHHSPRTLEKMRVRGDGPAFYKVGKKVIYRIEDLNAWIEKKRCQSTSEVR
jgi:hypothetical protein